MKKPAVLLLAPLPIDKDFIGGAMVCSMTLVEQFQRSGQFSLELINLSRPHHLHTGAKRLWVNLLALGRTILKSLLAMGKVDLVFVNISPGGSPAAALIWLFTRCFRKPMILRFFGGAYHTVFERQPWLLRKLAQWTFLRAEMVLLETRQQFNHFRSAGNIAIFPNTRAIEPVRVPTSRVPRKLLFMSQLRPEKGVHIAIAALEALPDEFSLDFYGPLMPGVDLQCFDGNPRLHYRGIASPDEVPNIFAHYDVLLFPSFYPGEGYPGVVIEALQCGLPVIATSWQAIPEILEGERGGLLVEPQSVEALVAAILRVREEPGLYPRLIAAALARGDEFRLDRWHQALEENLGDLIAARPPAWLRTQGRAQEVE